MTTTEFAHVERLTKELKDVREQAVFNIQKLAVAEEALRFYGNPMNYTPREIVSEKLVYQDLLKGDFTTADNSPHTHIAGRRARNYFSQYEKS